MIKNGMRPIHPGEILLEEYLKPYGLSANALSKLIHVPANRVSAIVKGTRGITASTALRLGRVFGTTPQFWMNLQQTYDLRVEETKPDVQREIGTLHALQANVGFSAAQSFVGLARKGGAKRKPVRAKRPAAVTPRSPATHAKRGRATKH